MHLEGNQPFRNSRQACLSRYKIHRHTTFFADNHTPSDSFVECRKYQMSHRLWYKKVLVDNRRDRSNTQAHL
jgi:hypothetical protein